MSNALQSTTGPSHGVLLPPASLALSLSQNAPCPESFSKDRIEPVHLEFVGDKPPTRDHDAADASRLPRAKKVLPQFQKSILLLNDKQMKLENM
jgi:hypothetical protein